MICSLDDYHNKRLSLQFEEAKELAKAYKAATGLIPPQHVFREFVFLFKNEEDEYGKLIEKSYEEILHINGNSQNPIDFRDLKSNDSIQILLETSAADLVNIFLHI